MLQRDGDLAAFDQSTGEVTVEAKIPRGERTHELPNAPRAIVGYAGHLWVACGRRGDRASEIVRVHPASGEITLWAISIDVAPG